MFFPLVARWGLAADNRLAWWGAGAPVPVFLAWWGSAVGSWGLLAGEARPALLCSFIASSCILE